MYILLVSVCSMSGQTSSGLFPERFRTNTKEGTTGLFILRNGNGMEVCLCNYGARVVSIAVPDRNGNPTDVTLGFDNIHDYMKINRNFGATIGRYANRIKNACFNLDGKEIRVQANNGPHCLHGGDSGWQSKIFDVKNVTDTTATFFYRSADGEEGFPGNVEADVTYSLSSDNELMISYHATTDKTTVINLTNHTFFNLSGTPDKTALDHILQINASRYTSIDSSFVPTGYIEDVSGTPMDFRTPAVISDRIDMSFPQVRIAGGYDHNWILDTKGCIDKPAASLYSRHSGIRLEVYTDEPGIQVFTGNAFNGAFEGRSGIRYRERPSICLETQHFPDSPNHPEWPSTILTPGDTYESKCIYRFIVVE